jgi:hypothetical protein
MALVLSDSENIMKKTFSCRAQSHKRYEQPPFNLTPLVNFAAAGLAYRLVQAVNVSNS